MHRATCCRLSGTISSGITDLLQGVVATIVLLRALVQDGDQYLVLWDEQLLQPRNSLAQDYTAEKPETVSSCSSANARPCSCRPAALFAALQLCCSFVSQCDAVAAAVAISHNTHWQRSAST
jgi:hypothetical protein